MATGPGHVKTRPASVDRQPRTTGVSPMAVRLSRETRELKEYAEELGFELARNHNGELVFRLPDTDVEVSIRKNGDVAAAKERLRRRAA
jgi:hypothetical protein